MVTLYNEQFGIRSSRREWDNARDLAQKDALPIEKAFRELKNLRPLRRGPLSKPAPEGQLAGTPRKGHEFDSGMLSIKDIPLTFPADVLTDKREAESAKKEKKELTQAKEVKRRTKREIRQGSRTADGKSKTKSNHFVTESDDEERESDLDSELEDDSDLRRLGNDDESSGDESPLSKLSR